MYLFCQRTAFKPDSATMDKYQPFRTIPEGGANREWNAYDYTKPRAGPPLTVRYTEHFISQWSNQVSSGLNIDFFPWWYVFCKVQVICYFALLHFFNAQSQTGEYRVRDIHVLLPSSVTGTRKLGFTRGKRENLYFSCRENEIHLHVIKMAWFDLAVRKLWIYVNFLFGKCALTTSVWEANMFIRHYHCI